MREIRLSKRSAAFLANLPAKHARQIVEKLDLLAENAEAAPSETLKGHEPMRRLRAGEYRIAFIVEGEEVQIPLIGKRNDDEIYKILGRSRRK